MLFHNGQVESVTRVETSIPKDNFFGTLSGGFIDVKHFIYDAEKSVERRLNGIPAIDRHVAMENFLQDLGVSDQALAVIDQFFHQPLSIALMRVRRTHQVHRDIRIHENHRLLLDE